MLRPSPRDQTGFDAGARFQDDDPTNDPPMLGVANRGCAHCHYR